MDIESVKYKIINWAKLKSEINKIYLYGSRAREEHREDSDIDIALVIENRKTITNFAIWICNGETWEKELKEIDQRIHPEWLDTSQNTKTPTVLSKFKKGNTLIYSRAEGK